MSESAHDTPVEQLRNPSVAYERSDVNARGVLWFGAALAALLFIVLVAMAALYGYFDRDEARLKRSTFPVAQRERQQVRERDPAELLPPAPRLDGLGPAVVDQASGRLNTVIGPVPDELKSHNDVWRWANAEHTAACMPVAEAMGKLLAKPGDYLKARNTNGGENAASPAGPPTSSSSGREAIGGPK